MNQVNGIGRIGSVDSRTTSQGTPVTSFSVALNERFTSKDGKPVEKVVWVRVTCWRKLAEIAKAILNVGDLVRFTGQLEQPSVYKNQKGETVASLEITASEVEKLSKKGEHNGNGSNGAAQAEPERTANIPAGEVVTGAAEIPMGDEAPF